MEFTEIDRQFEEAFERINRKTPPMMGAHGLAPLAADHFLLKKSWDYFRSRVKAIEDQWQKILHSKDQQLSSALAELKATRERIVELEDENRMLHAFDQQVKKARTEDYQVFANKAEKLRLRWDAEREALQRKVDSMEFKMAQQKKDLDAKTLAARAREENFNKLADGLRKEATTQAEQSQELQKRFASDMKEKDDRLLSLDTKLDMLRGELNRREAIIKELQQTIARHEADGSAMTAYIGELQRTLKDKDMELRQQKERYAILSNERESLRHGWERERAEWRELWDRGRSLWDKKQSPGT